MVGEAHGERIARLEEQNRAAEPVHVRFGKDISLLKTSVTRIETKMDILLTNGRPRKRTQAAVASGGVGLIVTVAAAWAKIMGWV